MKFIRFPWIPSYDLLTLLGGLYSDKIMLLELRNKKCQDFKVLGNLDVVAAATDFKI